MSDLPWKMWGTQAVLKQVGPGASNQVQLARINYGRPETWAFFLWARPLNLANDAQIVLTASFGLRNGLGRSYADQAPSFARGASGSLIEETSFGLFRWGGTNGYPMKWASRVLGPKLDDTDANSPRPWCDWIVGQDIQFSALIHTAGIVLPTTEVQVEMGAMLAPIHHVRPDWFVDEFSPGELQGA